MTSTVYLEQYFDSLDTLPHELNKGFALIRKHDTEVHELARANDSEEKEYFEKCKEMNPEQREEMQRRIIENHQRIARLGEQKIELSNKIYEMVDKHIRKLDTDLARFEADLKQTLSEGQTIESTNASSRKRKHDSDSSYTDGLPISSLMSTLSNPCDVLDMPIDPNEPTYCLCGDVSYGEMIGCDNPECPIEWFHFACVGLTNNPKGKWYCPKCSKKRNDSVKTFSSTT